MTYDLPAFPDIEEVLRNALLTRFGGGDEPPGSHIDNVVGSLPGDIGGETIVYVERIGGTRTRLNDYPMVDVEVFAPSRGLAKDVIESIDAFLLGYPHAVDVGVDRVIIDFVLNTRTPVRLFWDDSNSRFGATYSMSVRR